MWLAVALSAAAAFSAIASPVKTPHVEAELVPGNHTGSGYRNAGRVAPRMKRAGTLTGATPATPGCPTTLAWTLPAGVDAGPIEWPAPQLLPVGPLANFGYEGEVLLLTQLKPAGTLAPGNPVVLNARADWLVCKEICIPEGVDLALTLPVGNTTASDPRWGAPLAAARAALPRPLTGWQASAHGSGRRSR